MNQPWVFELYNCVPNYLKTFVENFRSFVKMLTLLLLGIVLASASGQDGCKQPAFLSSASGNFSSPYYGFQPDFTYPPSLKCRWTITVPEGKNVRLDFNDDFALENSCNYDSVRIFSADRVSDGQDACERSYEFGLAGPFCGTTPPPMIIIANSTAVIEFCTDSSVQYGGFGVSFSATDEQPPTPTPTTMRPTTPPSPEYRCPPQSVLLTGPGASAIIDSPNYRPGWTYPANTFCQWTIETDAPAIEINTVTFSTQCPRDTLRIHDTTNDIEIGTYCGTSGPMKLRTFGNRTVLVFETDRTQQLAGFRLSIKAVKCTANYLRCPNDKDDDVCFEPSMMCDGKRDCLNGEDEYCPMTCGKAVTPPYLSTKKDPRIVGGIEARPHSWPWQVAFLTASDNNQFCGGTIIDHNWVMTAAHCCEVRGPSGSNYRVRVGEHDLAGDREPNARTYEIDKVLIHPRYRRPFRYSYDFCLLKTKQPIFFNDDVLPVCMPSALDPPTGTDCFVTGWGSQDPWKGNNEAFKKHFNRTEETSAVRAGDSLRQVDIKIADQEYCKKQYNNGIGEDMICGENPRKDSCQGDSGGPFVCRSRLNPDQWELTGVVSWGRGCADPGYPGVYARMSYDLDWIAETILSN